MEQSAIRKHPQRITDLVGLKRQGARVTCETSFQVVPVDFEHRGNAYQAHVFMCYFAGEVNGEGYGFRKCYARGCSHNLCPHVSQAVMIANRYLLRDYRLLSEAGIQVEEKLFSLQDMLVKFEGYEEEHAPTLSLNDYVNLAREGNEVSFRVEPEYVSAVEHFANYKKAQTFLMVNFTAAALGRSHQLERCFACYPTEQEADEKPRQIKVANHRLEALYDEFDRVSIQYERRFFEP